MINFFWQVLGNLGSNEGNWFHSVCLIVSVLWMFGYLWSVFYAKDRRIFWVVSWIVTALVVLLIDGLVLLVKSYAGQHGNASGNELNVFIISFVLGFILFSLLGCKIIPTKSFHWLQVSLVFIGCHIGLLFGLWSMIAVPYGYLFDGNLSKETLEANSGFDYEIATRGKADGFDETHLLRIRVKGDSAYYQVIYDKCLFGRYASVDGWMNSIDRARESNSSSQWMLLDASKTSSIKKLKKRMASYEQEKILMMGRTGYCSAYVLDDFQESRRKALAFCDIEDTHVYDANSIEKLAKELWPPRSTHDDVVSKDSLPWCDEL